MWLRELRTIVSIIIIEQSEALKRAHQMTGKKIRKANISNENKTIKTFRLALLFCAIVALQLSAEATQQQINEYELATALMFLRFISFRLFYSVGKQFCCWACRKIDWCREGN